MIQANLKITFGESVFALQTGDITRVRADAIGNAANSELAGGGGVDGAIHRAGGPLIMRELAAIRARIGRCPPGEAVATGAGDLPARWVFHAVGPRYRGGHSGEATDLGSCYRRCLALADEHGARSLTLPAISTGVYGYPLEEAAGIAVQTTASILASGASQVRELTFVLFGEPVFRAFATATLGIMDRFGRT